MNFLMPNIVAKYFTRSNAVNFFAAGHVSKVSNLLFSNGIVS